MVGRWRVTCWGGSGVIFSSAWVVTVSSVCLASSAGGIERKGAELVPLSLEITFSLSSLPFHFPILSEER